MTIEGMRIDWWNDPAIVRMLVDNTIGPLLIGTSLSCCLCGVNLVLLFRYFAYYRQDRLAFKALAVCCTLLSLADTAIDCLWAFHWAVDDWNDIVSVARMPKEFFLFTVLLVTTSAICHFFFAWRCWVASLRRGYILVGFVSLCTLATMGIGYWFCYKTFAAFWLLDYLKPWRWLVAYFVCTAACDWSNSLGMLYWLVWKRRGNKGLIDGNARLTSIALYTVRTNLLVTSVQFVEIGLIFKSSGTAYATVALLLPKLYLASIIGALLTRPPSTPSQTIAAPDALPLPVSSPSRANNHTGPIGFFSLLGLSSMARREEGRSAARHVTSAEVCVTVEHTLEVCQADESAATDLFGEVGAEKGVEKENEVAVLPFLTSFAPPPVPSPPRPLSPPITRTPSIRSRASLAMSASGRERSRIAPFATEEEVDEAVEAEESREEWKEVGEQAEDGSAELRVKAPDEEEKNRGAAG
ncbi:hypothetical protein JCM8547_007344 [Rhodosporidiobolus lusitaniae]